MSPPKLVSFKTAIAQTEITKKMFRYTNVIKFNENGSTEEKKIHRKTLIFWQND